MLRNIGGYLAAVVVAYVLASIASTQSVLANLTEMGVSIDLSTRFAAIGHDLLGLLTIYLPIIALAFLIAWPVTALIVRWLPRLRTAGYVLAGFAAIIAAHLILKQLVEITGSLWLSAGLSFATLLGLWVFGGNAEFEAVRAVQRVGLSAARSGDTPARARRSARRRGRWMAKPTLHW